MGDSIFGNYRQVNGGRDFNLETYDTTLQLRPRVLQGIIANDADVNFVKTHNVNAQVMGVNLIPPEITRASIYIVRNPLDVTLSFARHFGRSHEETVKGMADTRHVTTPSEGNVWQFLGSWSDHVSSWNSKHAYPSLTVRYEDMLEKPMETFGAMLQLIGIPVDEDRLEKAIRFSSFDETVKQEKDSGFVEASPKSERFFAKGKSGQWRDGLEPALISKTRRWHRKVMKKYGYLDE